MPNGDTCSHHTALAVQVGRLDTRLDEGDERMTRIEKSTERIEGCVERIQAMQWKMVGAIAVLVFLLSIFGGRIALAIFGE